MRAVFISYRRDDVEGHAGRLFQDLATHFGENAIFMDVAGIEPGRDFRKVIDQQVASCGVLLALIGKSWLDSKNGAGVRRLEDPADFVRLETVAALKRDIPVIPVLVHGARMPRAEDLPAELKDLAYRNYVELTHTRWQSDVQLLVKALRPHVDPHPERTTVADVAPSAVQSEHGNAVAPAHASAGMPPAPPRQQAGFPLGVVLLVIAALIAGGGGYMLYDNFTEESTGSQKANVRERVAQAGAETSKAAADKAAANKPAADKAAADKAAADKAAADKAAAAKAVAGKTAVNTANAAQGSQKAAPAHSISLIALEPPPNSVLANHQRVKVSFSYVTTERGGVRVVLAPMAGGSPAPNNALETPKVLPSGNSTSQESFTITSGGVTVDGIDIRMYAQAGGQLLYNFTVPARYEFRDNSQQQQMYERVRICEQRAQARKLTGDQRRQFMDPCLSGKA
jgi:hypothetical protein